VQGNIKEETAVENVKKFINILNCGSLLPDMIPQMRVSEIPLGTHYCKLKNINKIDANSVVMNYYQAGVESIELSVLIDLLMVMWTSSFYEIAFASCIILNVAYIFSAINGRTIIQ